jgi:hypothetical protein
MLPELVEDVMCLTADEFVPPPADVPRRTPEKFELLFSERMVEKEKPGVGAVSPVRAR